MNDNPSRIEQKAEGIGIAQALGEGATAITFLGIPIEKWLIGELIAAIIIQGLGYFCSLGTRDPAFCTLVLGLCFPIIFGLPALFGLIMGVSVKNRKVIILSLVSGALSLLIFGPLYLCGSLTNLAQRFGS
jgi:hypothetical protein